MNWKNFVCSVVCLAGMTCAEAVNYTPENVAGTTASASTSSCTTPSL